MRISEYGLELEDSKAILVKERAFNYKGTESFSSSLEVADFLASEYRANKKAEEHVYLIGLNNRNKVMGVFKLSHGVVDSSFVDPKAIFQRLLLLGCPRFIIAHNHPSGDTTPSLDDIKTSKRIKEGADLLNLSFLDFLVLGESLYLSFGEKKLGGF
jgi:DNA repair protein RadC